MHELPVNCVPKEAWVNGRWCPESVDTVCPHCGRMVNLRLEGHLFDAQRNTISASAKCPGCHKTMKFWVIEPGQSEKRSNHKCAYLAMYPRPRQVRQPIMMPDKFALPVLGRVYQSACNAYNAGLWAACAISCRKTLEGLVQTMLAEEDRKGRLFEQLKKLPEKVDLARPIVALADTLRKGGNLGAHFDLEKEPDQHIAELMLDLLDYFMEYIYVLEEKSRQLDEKIEAIGGK